MPSATLVTAFGLAVAGGLGACAVVLILRYSRTGRGDPHPMAMEFTYSRADGEWMPDPHSLGALFSHDPVANPGRQRDLDGRHLTISSGTWSQTAAPGRPAVILAGSASPAVAYLAVARDGREERRPLDSHFGAWVICAEEPGPIEVIAYDADGAVLDRLREEPPPGVWQSLPVRLGWTSSLRILAIDPCGR